MAQNNNAVGMQPPRDIPWPIAFNDHYCPSEVGCRHGVIDIRGVDEVKERVETTRGRDNCSVHSNRRSSASDTTVSDSGYGGSGSLYEEGESSATDRWDRSSPSTCYSGCRETDNGYLTTLAHRNPVTAVPESVNADIEQIKIMQVFIKSLMQENISNRRRLEFLEGFTLDRSTDLEARGVTLAEQCDVFNEQLMLLARQHDDLLDIMQQFSITFFEHARTLEDLKEWRQSQQLAERTSKEPGHSTIFDQEAPRSTHNPDTRRESISSLSISDATVERKPVRLRIRTSKPGPDPGHSTTLDQEAPRSTHNTDTRWESISPLSISDATAERQPVRLRINMRKSGPPALKTGLITPPATDDEIDPASMQLIKMIRAEKPDDTRQNRRMSAKALEEAATSGKQHERKRNSGSSDEARAAKRPRVRPFGL